MGIGGGIGRQQDCVADDVEGQLPRLSAEQLGLQEGGPFPLQQLFTAHVILGTRAESGGAPCLACPRPIRSLLVFIGPQPIIPAPTTSLLALPWKATPPAQGADLADSGHAGSVEFLEELKFAGCLLEEEVDDLGRRDGCHEGGVRCGVGQIGLRIEHLDALGSPW